MTIAEKRDELIDYCNKFGNINHCDNCIIHCEETGRHICEKYAFTDMRDWEIEMLYKIAFPQKSEIPAFIPAENDTKQHKFITICSELCDIYTAKNADYGDSFGEGFKEYGMIMPVIRLEDKLRRLKRLSKNEAKVKDESILDTLRDLANYAIMTIIELDGGSK